MNSSMRKLSSDRKEQALAEKQHFSVEARELRENNTLKLLKQAKLPTPIPAGILGKVEASFWRGVEVGSFVASNCMP